MDMLLRSNLFTDATVSRAECGHLWHAISTTIVYEGIVVLALIKCNEEDKVSVINVDVDGKCHEVPFDKILNRDSIETLFIRFFSPTSFVVFARIDNGPWPFGCFLQTVDGSFQSKVCYSIEAVADIAVIENRFLVINEIISCHGHLCVNCYDMETAECVWSANTELTDYLSHHAYLETVPSTNSVKIHLEHFPSETSRLVLTANEHGIVDAVSKSSVMPRWSWKLSGDDQPFRTEPIVVVKPAVSAK